MRWHHTNRVVAPDFAVKLVCTMRDASRFHGTGFAVVHEEKQWLVTCRHNVELESFDFAGCNDLAQLDIVSHGTLSFDNARRVVGLRVNDRIVDAVAIELREGEYSTDITPGFDTSIRMSMEGENFPDSVTILGPPPERYQLAVRPLGYVALQGFPGDALASTTLKGVQLAELPGVLDAAWMIRFVPAPTPGFSGGPVLRLTNTSASLLGITTHEYSGRFQAAMPDGRVAIIDLTAGAAVPIEPLLHAMARAGPGQTITDVAFELP